MQNSPRHTKYRQIFSPFICHKWKYLQSFPRRKKTKWSFDWKTKHETRCNENCMLGVVKFNENDYLMSVYKLGVCISLCFQTGIVRVLFNVRKKKVVSYLFFFILARRFSCIQRKRLISAVNRKLLAKKLAFFPLWIHITKHEKNEWLLSPLLSFAHTKIPVTDASFSSLYEPQGWTAFFSV